jgi:uncharacterized protein YjbJ (UPF0337 family)
MTVLPFKRTWNRTTRILQQQWRQFTASDLQRTQGRREELLCWIQHRTGQTREAVESSLKESCASCC